MGEIAILGWGSLCWNPGDLPLGSSWRTGGPILPLEFSRISKDGRLTLVLDTSGTLCETRFAWSAATTLSASIEALLVREETVRMWIGYRDGMGGGSSVDRSPDQLDINEIVVPWIANQQDGASAAVWTALPPNFAEKRAQEFSVENAMEYLRSLEDDALRRALEYIANAPPEVRTPLRGAATAEWQLRT